MWNEDSWQHCQTQTPHVCLHWPWTWTRQVPDTSTTHNSLLDTLSHFWLNASLRSQAFSRQQVIAEKQWQQQWFVNVWTFTPRKKPTILLQCIALSTLNIRCICMTFSDSCNITNMPNLNSEEFTMMTSTHTDKCSTSYSNSVNSSIKRHYSNSSDKKLTSRRSGPTTSLARMAGDGLLDETSPCWTKSVHQTPSNTHSYTTVINTHLSTSTCRDNTPQLSCSELHALLQLYYGCWRIAGCAHWLLMINNNW